jgi:hypothetical protein
MTQATITESLSADLAQARTWAIINGASTDAALAAAAVTGQPPHPPDPAWESASADFRCAMRDVITERRLAELRERTSG